MTLQEITGLFWDDISQFGEFHRRLVLDSYEIQFSEGYDDSDRRVYEVRILTEDGDSWQDPDLQALWESVLTRYPGVGSELEGRIQDFKQFSEELFNATGFDWEQRSHGDWECEQGPILYTARRMGAEVVIATEIQHNTSSVGTSVYEAWNDAKSQVRGLLDQVYMGQEFAASRRELQRILDPNYVLPPEIKAVFDALDREAELRKATEPPLSPEEVTQRLASWVADAGSDYKTVRIPHED